MRLRKPINIRATYTDTDKIKTLNHKDSNFCSKMSIDMFRTIATVSAIFNLNLGSI